MDRVDQRDATGRWVKGVTPKGAKPFKPGQSGNPRGSSRTVDKKNRLRAALQAQEQLRRVLGDPEGSANAILAAAMLAEGAEAMALKPQKVVEAAENLAALITPIVRATKGPRAAKRIFADDKAAAAADDHILVQKPAPAYDIFDPGSIATAFGAEMLETLAEVARDKAAPHSARVSAANSLLDRSLGRPQQNIAAKVETTDMSAMHLAALKELALRGAKTIDLPPAPEAVADGGRRADLETSA